MCFLRDYNELDQVRVKEIQKSAALAGFPIGLRPMGGGKSPIFGAQNRKMVVLGPKNA